MTACLLRGHPMLNNLFTEVFYYICEAATEPPGITTSPRQVGSPCHGACGFTQTTGGCFFAKNTTQKKGDDAEAVCQAYGSNVHLATLDTQQVGIFIFIEQNHPHGSIFLSLWRICFRTELADNQNRRGSISISIYYKVMKSRYLPTKSYKRLITCSRFRSNMF